MDFNQDEQFGENIVIKRESDIKELEAGNWQTWCRLCATYDDSNISLIDVHILNSSVDLLQAIEKYFSLKIILEEQHYPRMLCIECSEFIKKIIYFEKRILEIQEVFKSMIDDNNLNNEKDSGDKQIDENLKFELGLPQYHSNDEQQIKATNEENNPLEIIYEADKKSILEAALLCEEMSNDSKDIESSENSSTIIDDIAASYNEKIKNSRLECKICSKTFSYKYYYQLHLKHVHKKDIHLVEHKCTHCTRIFNRKMNLEKHLKTHFAEDEKHKIVECPQCNVKVKAYRLNLHIKLMHVNGHRYLCDECGNAYRTIQGLTEHKLTHTDYAPYICQHCNKGFKAEKLLKKHMDKHETGKRICNVCNAELKSKLTLKRHMVIHSTAKPFKCDYCGFTCKRAKSLKTHLISHTGIKPYGCEICYRSFSSAANCRAHMRRAHPAEFAEQEALGVQQCTRNVPNLAALRALAKSSKNLKPIAPRRTKIMKNDELTD